jgi:tetratricopeptide (TPR) repeat protein
MRMPAIAVLSAAVALSACAAHRPAPLVETGFAPGTLGLAAIERGDLQTAERLLTSGRATEGEAARLINLGHVYMETGRTGEALSAWRLALASDRHEEVVTRDGRVIATDALAREALARHDRALAQATR